MRRLILSAMAMAILTPGLWAQASSQGTQAPAPSTGASSDSGKKSPEGKSGKHHHHKHHHKKAQSQ